MINYEMALSEIEMYKKAHESLSENLTHANKKAQQFKAERDTLIDDIAVLRANNERLEHENKRLTRLTHKLTTHRTMWGSLKDWRRDMLEIDKNDTQLISLGLVMDDLEKRHLYKGDE